MGFFFVFSSSILDVHICSEKQLEYSVNDNSSGKMCRFQEWLVDQIFGQILYCKKKVGKEIKGGEHLGL